MTGQSAVDAAKRVLELAKEVSLPWGMRPEGYVGSWQSFRISPQCTDRGGMTAQAAEYAVTSTNAAPALAQAVLDLTAEVEGLKSNLQRAIDNIAAGLKEELKLKAEAARLRGIVRQARETIETPESGTGGWQLADWAANRLARLACAEGILSQAEEKSE